MAVGFQAPQMPWMMNTSHGFGGSGSMFDIAGQNLGFDKNDPAYGGQGDVSLNQQLSSYGSESDAHETLKKSKDVTPPTPGGEEEIEEGDWGSAVSQGFQQAGSQISNMYNQGSGSIFS